MFAKSLTPTGDVRKTAALRACRLELRGLRCGTADRCATADRSAPSVTCDAAGAKPTKWHKQFQIIDRCLLPRQSLK